MKILNLYAGIGGNRKLWGNTHNITAVEIDNTRAEYYQELYPKDKIIVADSHEYLLKNYMNFEFIWSSPPCPSHSDIRRCGVKAGKHESIYPDMKLYEEIILLTHFSESKWIVENVVPYYKALISPTIIIDRHYFWCNFIVKTFRSNNKENIVNIHGGSTVYDFNIKDTKINDKRKTLRNLVNPEIGKHLLDCAIEDINQPKTIWEI